jgi:hypothetical protein
VPWRTKVSKGRIIEVIKWAAECKVCDWRTGAFSTKKLAKHELDMHTRSHEPVRW